MFFWNLLVSLYQPISLMGQKFLNPVTHTIVADRRDRLRCNWSGKRWLHPSRASFHLLLGFRRVMQVAEEPAWLFCETSLLFSSIDP